MRIVMFLAVVASAALIGCFHLSRECKTGDTDCDSSRGKSDFPGPDGGFMGDGFDGDGGFFGDGFMDDDDGGFDDDGGLDVTDAYRLD